MKRALPRFLKIFFIAVLVILVLLFSIPFLFPGKVVERVKAFANEKIDGEINFSKVRLSFFNHFPSLTVTLYDVALKGSAPFKNDTLVAAHEIALGINVTALLFRGDINIDKIFVSDAFFNVQVNEEGQANYNVYVDKSRKHPTSPDSSETALRLEKIRIDDTHLVYNDRSTDMLIDARGLNYDGSGDLSKNIFDLNSNLQVDSLNLVLSKEPYLLNKSVNAQLVTKVNTNSLAFIFEKNDLRINRLPVQFSGKLDFLSNGYDMDFTLTSQNNTLPVVFSAFPPQYLTWMNNVELKGETDLFLTLKGEYIVSKNKAPDLIFNVNLTDGYVKHKVAPQAVSGILLSLHSKLPSLDTDNLEVKIDTVYLNVNKDYLKGRVYVLGLNKPNVDANLHADIDLANLVKSLGVDSIDLRGKLLAHVVSKGKYDPDDKSFPVTRADLILQNGFVKTAYYPNAIDKIDIRTKVTNTTGALKDLHVIIEPITFNFEQQPFRVEADLRNFENIVYDLKAHGQLDVGRIYKVFSQEGLELDGFIKADVSLKGSREDAEQGRYDQLQNSGVLTLKNIRTRSTWLPHAFLIKDGTFRFDRDRMSFENFLAVYGQSDFRMNGYLQNMIDYLFSSGSILKGQFAVQSDFINVDEFMSNAPPEPEDTVVTKGGVIVVPKVYNLSLTANAGKVKFGDLMLQNVTSSVAVDTGTLMLNKTGFSVIGCDVEMNAKYRSRSASKANFEYAISAKDFDIRRAYDSVKIFRDLASSAAYAEGVISLDYQLKGALDRNMSPIYPSLEGGGTISVKDVKVKGYKLFSVISKQTGRDSLDNPNLKKVVIKSTIKNNIINIERFRFKVFGFRPRIEGQTSFDGALNLKMRLGLPPLGIIGIPIRVTGTQDEPVVRLGKQTKALEETEYTDEPEE